LKLALGLTIFSCYASTRLLLTRDLVTHQSTCSCVGCKRASPASGLAGRLDRYRQPVRLVFHGSPQKSNKLLPRRDPVGAGVPWCVLASPMPARRPSIATGMKEEQQITVRVEFGVERRRITVERSRTTI
jgi:hypothetical protein